MNRKKWAIIARLRVGSQDFQKKLLVVIENYLRYLLNAKTINLLFEDHVITINVNGLDTLQLLSERERNEEWVSVFSSRGLQKEIFLAISNFFKVLSLMFFKPCIPRAFNQP